MADDKIDYKSECLAYLTLKAADERVTIKDYCARRSAELKDIVSFSYFKKVLGKVKKKGDPAKKATNAGRRKDAPPRGVTTPDWPALQADYLAWRFASLAEVARNVGMHWRSKEFREATAGWKAARDAVEKPALPKTIEMLAQERAAQKVRDIYVEALVIHYRMMDLLEKTSKCRDAWKEPDKTPWHSQMAVAVAIDMQRAIEKILPAIRGLENLQAVHRIFDRLQGGEIDITEAAIDFCKAWGGPPEAYRDHADQAQGRGCPAGRRRGGHRRDDHGQAHGAAGRDRHREGDVREGAKANRRRAQAGSGRRRRLVCRPGPGGAEVNPYWSTTSGSIYLGNALDLLGELPAGAAQCCVTSPPYWGLRDYGLQPTRWPSVRYAPMPGLPPVFVPEMECCLGLEPSVEAYVGHMTLIFDEVRRALNDAGTLWLNLGDSFSANRGYQVPDSKHRDVGNNFGVGATGKSSGLSSGVPSKNKIGIPWRVCFALQASGWILRMDLVWNKPNTMPESVNDRPTLAHEMLFLFSKSAKYDYDADAIKEPHGYNRWSRNRTQDAAVLNAVYGGQAGSSSILREGKINPFPAGGRNRRSVWTIPTKPFPGAHFATFPPALIEPCILAGAPKGSTVIDPFLGSGTAALVAHRLDRRWIGIDMSKAYVDEIAIPRINAESQQLRLFA